MKRFMAILLISLMVFTVVGCGGSSNGRNNDIGNNGGKDDGESNDDTNTGSNSGNAIVDGDFYQYEEVYDVFRTFKELDFVFNSTNDQGVDYSMAMHFIFLGKDKVGDVDTEHYTLTVGSDDEVNTYEIWFNDANEIVKVKEGDEITEGAWASMAAFGFIWHILPFMAYSSGFESNFTEPDGFNVFTVVDKKSQNKNFGTGNVKVERYDVRYTWAAIDLIFNYEVAKIGQKYMFTYWRFKLIDEYMEMTVNKAIPR